MKILVIQTAFIGDVILASSLLESIRNYYPKAKIDFLLRAGNESLLQNHPLINKVLIWNKKEKYKSLFSKLREIRKERYDLCLNIQRYTNSGVITALSKAKVKIGFDKNPMSWLFTKKVKHMIPHIEEGHTFHEVQRNLLLLKAYNSNVMLPKDATELPLSLNIPASPINIEEEYIVLAPASVWFTKQMDQEKWRELSQKLSQSYKLCFIGAPGDKGYIEEIIQGLDNCDNLAGKLSLLESAALMKGAKRVFVNDSAPLHLASAAQAKTTAIFCSTHPDFGYGPLSREHSIVQITEKLECRPCGLHGKVSCPKEHFKCSKDISLEQLLETIK